MRMYSIGESINEKTDTARYQEPTTRMTRQRNMMEDKNEVLLTHSIRGSVSGEE